MGMRTIAAFSFVLFFTSTAWAQPVALPNGAEAPGLLLERIDGGSLDLSAVIGRKPVLLEFWATWCEKCEALHPHMLDAWEQFSDRVEFVGIAVGVGQGKRGVRRHLDKQPLPFPMTWDGEGEAVRAYEVMLTSTIVVVDATGRVAYTGTGKDQDPVAILAELFGGP